MTTPAPAYKVVNLFNGLLRRARKKQNCLSLQSMTLAYEFAYPAQTQNALDRLVQSGHIRIDIGGKHPAIRVVKDGYKALHECQPMILSPAKVEAGQAKVDPAPKPIVTPDPKPNLDVAVKMFANAAMAARTPDPAPDRPFNRLPPLQAKQRSRSMSFHIPPEDHAWLQEHFPASGASSVAAFARDIFIAELNRRRTDGQGKFRVSAAVVRAAQDADQPLDLFITNLLELGLRAREAEAL